MGDAYVGENKCGRVPPCFSNGCACVFPTTCMPGSFAVGPPLETIYFPCDFAQNDSLKNKIKKRVFVSSNSLHAGEGGSAVWVYIIDVYIVW